MIFLVLTICVENMFRGTNKHTINPNIETLAASLNISISKLCILHPFQSHLFSYNFKHYTKRYIITQNYATKCRDDIKKLYGKNDLRNIRVMGF